MTPATTFGSVGLWLWTLSYLTLGGNPTAVSPIIPFPAQSTQTDPASTLDCHRRPYKYDVTQADSNGRICWDTIVVMSCWGRCDSNEISDWRFPYKRSYHPVCLHGDREVRTTTLKHCEEGAEPGTEIYSFLNAVTCRCHVCKSSEASCEGFRYPFHHLKIKST